ncbi:death-associated inhibitor of apoptosis 1 [Harpegnathos saltator]|uniref:Apoptosis inhibitor IAP n=1 Tax=Harpegnathos saltator TaxID=610380 RepID=E2BCE3_HARSA|nr:death-associated inhibitor of apoptosis 1 [Harpegnathos saltator]EFN86679.1 Apoptosis inhibitor IAP [Harpegnathos saltator]
MTPRTQRNNALYESTPATLQLMSFKNVPYDIPYDIIDEVDGADYRYEIARLESFKNWPVPYMKPERLAAAGFYFTGELDIVKCFECGTETYKWMEGDDPMVDHARQSPMCKFVRNTSCDNVPIDVVPDISTVPPITEGRDVCGPYEYDFSSDYYSRCLTNSSSSIYAKYPQYKFYDIRLRTFDHWPASFKQHPDRLSLAGFYYTGKGDQVLCFHCGVGVKNWEPSDEPWEQHAIWFPNCNYLLKVKGWKYVEEITGQSILPKDLQTESYIAKMEGSVGTELGTKRAKLDEEDRFPGPSSQSSQGTDDSGLESMSGDNSSVEGSNENLSDAEAGCSKSISDTTLCKICYDAEVSQLFLPCGHLVVCVACSKCIDICPVCRAHVTQQMKVYFS